MYWSSLFNATIERLVKTQPESNKAVTIGDLKHNKWNTSYNGREVGLNYVLSYES